MYKWDVRRVKTHNSDTVFGAVFADNLSQMDNQGRTIRTLLRRSIGSGGCHDKPLSVRTVISLPKASGDAPPTTISQFEKPKSRWTRGF